MRLLELEFDCELLDDDDELLTLLKLDELELLRLLELELLRLLEEDDRLLELDRLDEDGLLDEDSSSSDGNSAGMSLRWNTYSSGLKTPPALLGPKTNTSYNSSQQIQPLISNAADVIN